jgi:hypothetical protein
MPYQICWYWLFSTSFGNGTINLKMNIINIGLRYLALTIRNLNYTLNFFLYSLTSTVFLKEAFTIARCNYFLDQNFLDHNPSCGRLRRLFALSDKKHEQQPINITPNHEISMNMNYQSFSKNQTNGHVNSDGIHLKQLTVKPKQKKLKWNLKPMNETLSHLNSNDDDDDDDDAQQQQLQLSSNYTSTSNINENNNQKN